MSARFWLLAIPFALPAAHVVRIALAVLAAERRERKAAR